MDSMDSTDSSMDKAGANEPLSDDLQALAASRAARYDHLFAKALAQYLTLNRLDERGLLAMLRCSPSTLNRLRLCGRPEPQAPGFALDIGRVAEKLGLEAGMLAAIVREVDAAEAVKALATRRKMPPFSSTSSGMLRAARDHEPDPETAAQEQAQEQEQERTERQFDEEREEAADGGSDIDKG